MSAMSSRASSGTRGVLVASLSSVLDNSLEDVKGQQAAYYQSQVTTAAQKYIAANSAIPYGTWRGSSSSSAMSRRSGGPRS